MSRSGAPVHQAIKANHRRRIGAIGSEIDAGGAATRCVDYGRRRGSVVVIVDDTGVCWALDEGTPATEETIARHTSSVIGTFLPGTFRGVLTEIRDGIEDRMRELGA